MSSGAQPFWLYVSVEDWFTADKFVSGLNTYLRDTEPKTEDEATNNKEDHVEPDGDQSNTNKHDGASNNDTSAAP
jgi:hypothetical protein